MTPPDLPAPIDRAALERIIQRATELQTGEREIGDAMTPDDVLRLGKDVGIPERYLQQAMLEEQTRVGAAVPTGALDRIVGPAEVHAQRVVRGTREEVEERLLQWIDDEELLALQRQQPGRITWEPLRGMQVALRKSAAVLGSGRRPFMLQRATLLSAAITPLEPGFCHVALSADLRPARSSMIGGAGALIVLGLAGAGAIAVMSPYLWFAAVPGAVGLGLASGAARQYRPVAERARLGLERALDNLERGEIKPSHLLPPRGGVVGAILDEVRKAIG
jgi:hypothetical protein